ncbi:MAG: flagellar biosynthesis anti-sigma factor FlgM [Cellulosilyticaceae bacterium]
MRIDGVKHITKAYEQYNQNVAKTKIEQQKDKVELSQQALDIQKAYKLAKQQPDIRQEKVDAIKERIQSGTYTIDAKEVSEKIMSQLDIRG